MAGLNRLLESVSALYRSHGYPFVQVYMPPQTTVDGLCRLPFWKVTMARFRPVGTRALPLGAEVPECGVAVG
jgi:hemolysin activation/secretion protein